MAKLIVCFGKASPAAIFKRSELTWAAFAASLTAMPPEVTDKTARGWYIPADFDPQYRDSENFVARYALTFDFDHVDWTVWDKVAEAWASLDFAMYTTFSHTEEKPRFRVVIPLSRPCGYDEYQALARMLATDVGIENVARESFVPAQMMYAPTRKAGGEFHSKINKGGPLDVDAVLSQEYTDWTDRTQWPHRKDGDGVHSKQTAQTPPSEKLGIVGDFCRAFNIPAAIERFNLPYTPTATEGRWTYTAGSRPEGAILYDEGQKLHSHHDTDPARGQSNAFDLVRLHRFADLDSEQDRALPVTERPSYKAMAALAREQHELQHAAAEADFQDLGPLPAVTEEVILTPGDHETHRFHVYDARDFSAGPAPDWIVRGVLPRAELCVIYGESGSGKSFLALDLAAAVTRGISWRDKRVNSGKVVYVCAEGAGGFKSRLRAYASGHGCDLQTLPAVVSDAPNLLQSSDAAALTHGILQWGRPDVVVIDTLSATAPGGNENSGEDMGKVLSHCKFIHKKTGALVVLIHHSGKDATKGARGWSGLRAAADAEIEVTRNGEYRSAEVTKMKDGGDGESWPFRLKVVNLDVNTYGETESSCTIEHTSEAVPDSGQKPSGDNQRLLLEVLKELCAGGNGISQNSLRQEFNERSPEPEAGKRDRRPELFTRALTGLLVRKLAYKGGEIVSLSPVREADQTEWMEET